MVTDHIDRGETDHAALHSGPSGRAASSNATSTNGLLPEWGDSGANVDDATWIAALEASRRRQFAELADLE